MNDNAELRWRADENFCEMFRTIARGAVGGATLEEDGALMVSAGARMALFNPAFPRPGADFGAFVERARAFYQPRAMPWALRVLEQSPVAARAPLRAAGFLELDRMPVLYRVTDIPDHWPAPPAALDIQAVATEAQLGGHRRLLDLAFGLSDEVTRITLPAVPATPLLLLYVAYLNGEPVGSAALCEAAGVAGVYNVAAHPKWQRQGIATALMRRALADARERGLRTCVLQATTEGRPLYDRLGFARLSTYQFYIYRRDDEDDG